MNTYMIRVCEPGKKYNVTVQADSAAVDQGVLQFYRQDKGYKSVAAFQTFTYYKMITEEI